MNRDELKKRESESEYINVQQQAAAAAAGPSRRPPRPGRPLVKKKMPSPGLKNPM